MQEHEQIVVELNVGFQSNTVVYEVAKAPELRWSEAVALCRSNGFLLHTLVNGDGGPVLVCVARYTYQRLQRSLHPVLIPSRVALSTLRSVP